MPHWTNSFDKGLSYRLLPILFVLLFAIPVIPANGANFSQRPGFAQWYANNPPSDELPSVSDQVLLKKHRPRVYLPVGHDGLTGFYQDYVSGGVLRDGKGEVVSRNVTRAVLNAHKSDPEAVFTPAPFTPPEDPRVFGRIVREQVTWQGEARELTFLTYHLVFARSGLPGGLLGWQKLALGLIGDLKDWHQLDHYTAATLVLDAQENPFALVLQQHNYQRTYLLGEIAALPEDGRVEIDVAIGSNELFPHAAGRRNHRAVPFMTPVNFRYMIGTGGRPYLTADDVTEPANEAEYTLGFLPPADAFYTFQGSLGALRLLPGRDGPPGADYNTLPELKPLTLQMLSGYWREKNPGDIRRLERALRTQQYWLAHAKGQADVFFSNAACAKRWGENCAFD